MRPFKFKIHCSVFSQESWLDPTSLRVTCAAAAGVDEKGEERKAKEQITFVMIIVNASLAPGCPQGVLSCPVVREKSSQIMVESAELFKAGLR